MDKKQPALELIEVTLVIDGHTHQGKPVNKGDKIKVTAAEREWLAKLPVPAIKL